MYQSKALTMYHTISSDPLAGPTGDMDSKEDVLGYKTYKATSLFTQYIERPSLLKMLDNVNGKSILDMGCGWGYYCRQMATQMRPGRVLGIDSSERMINAARRFNQDLDISFLQCDCTALPFRDEFDVILANFLLPYCESRAILREVIEHMYQALKVGGSALGFLPNTDPGIEFGSISRYGFSCSIPPRVRDGQCCEVRFYNGEGHRVLEKAFHWYGKRMLQSEFYKAGFQKFEFITPFVSEQGLQKYGAKFWKKFMEPPRAIIFCAQK